MVEARACAHVAISSQVVQDRWLWVKVLHDGLRQTLSLGMPEPISGQIWRGRNHLCEFKSGLGVERLLTNLNFLRLCERKAS